MLPLVSLAVGLASKFIPGLIAKSLDSESAGKIAKTVIAEACKLSPDSTEKDALQYYEELLAKDPAAVSKLNDLIIGIVDLQLQDVQHARELGTGDDKLTYMIVLLSFIGIALSLSGLVYVVKLDIQSGDLAAISTLIGGVITLLGQQVQQISNYKYGSSVGAKIKR